jgi:hypothetical protein
MGSSLPDDLLQDSQLVSDWVKDIFRVHCDRILVKVIDAASIEGVYKALKYNARRYPAVIVNKKDRYLGSQSLGSAADEIGRQLAVLPAAA